MRRPNFWNKSPSFLSKALAFSLAPLGMLYGAITLFRMCFQGYKAALPVFCIGNATVGGTGKTPVVLALYQLLRGMGHKPVILTRGYGGQEKGPLLVLTQNAQQIGDEARMMANEAHVIVSKNRVLGAKLAEQQGFSCILMDDGFQNPQLEKDYSFLVLDRGAQENGYIFPAGALRAPLGEQISKAQALILTGEGEMDAFAYEKPVFETQEEAKCLLPLEMPILAFCGIGRPQKFHETLHRLGYQDLIFEAFPDHFSYPAAIQERLCAQAQKEGRVLLTTAKDAVKWAEDNPVEYVRFSLKFKDEMALKNIFYVLLKR